MQSHSLFSIFCLLPSCSLFTDYSSIYIDYCRDNCVVTSHCEEQFCRLKITGGTNLFRPKLYFYCLSLVSIKMIHSAVTFMLTVNFFPFFTVKSPFSESKCKNFRQNCLKLSTRFFRFHGTSFFFPFVSCHALTFSVSFEPGMDKDKMYNNYSFIYFFNYFLNFY